MRGDLDKHTLEARNRLREGKKQNRESVAKITIYRTKKKIKILW
jgi:hypothetical protein